jgi:predicted SprT family Zn-dependent metalloprotease
MSDLETISKLKNVYEELSKEHNFVCPCEVEIVISNKLRSSNGRIEYETRRWNNEIIKAKVTMSKALLTEFGWETFEQTFRHEIAHLANKIIYSGKNHDNTFKLLCRKFGGKMNTTMAGVAFRDCASDKFVEPIAKWIYTCPCGYEKKMGKRMIAKKRGNPRYRCGYCKKHTLDTWTERKVD